MTGERANVNIFRLLLRLWCHLQRRRKIQFLLLLGLMLSSAFAEVATLGAILPFLGVLADPDTVLNYSIAQRVASLLGYTNGQQLVPPLTLLFIAVALLSALFRLLLLWVSARLSNLVGVDLGYQVYTSTLYQPYQTHLMRNSSVIINGITKKVDDSVHALNLALNLVIASLLVVSVAITLFVINPLVALIAASIFGVGYGVVGMLFRNLLSKNSYTVAEKSTQLVQAIQEGVGGIRDVLLDGNQTVYGETYRRINHPLQVARANNVLYAGCPRYVMEAMGMTLIAFLAYSLSQKSGGVSGALPMLGALALAAQRMLPNLQQMYASWAGITGSQASLHDTLDLLDQPLPKYAWRGDVRPIEFTDDIRLDHVCFKYDGQDVLVLNDICLSVSKGEKIGIVGATGSGKSTLMDLLMGLLEPTSGSLIVDGVRMQGEILKSWQRAIAHVPQSVFLSDGTIAENIAFGVPQELIDMDRVRRVSKQAQLTEFFEHLELGYQTVVGERGVRLSGGQRQRIGIARALYKQASVIVFDEATSALDNVTERSVMEAIDALDSDLTLFLIAHRLSTVQRCDRIIVLDHGSIVACGKYDELLESSEAFRSLAMRSGEDK